MACCRDTTKKAKKLPFDKQKEVLNTLEPSLVGQNQQNSLVPVFLGHYFQFMEI